MQYVTWQDLIQLGIMVAAFGNLFYMIYCNHHKK